MRRDERPPVIPGLNVRHGAKDDGGLFWSVNFHNVTSSERIGNVEKLAVLCIIPSGNEATRCTGAGIVPIATHGPKTQAGIPIDADQRATGG
jgi:hypothetical protein